MNFVFVVRVVEGSKKINLGFSLHNQYEDILTYLYSDFQNVCFSGDKEELLKICCVVNEFPINNGKIMIKGRIEVDGIESDWPKESLAIIDIEKGDYYGTGRISEINTPFLIKGIWELSKEL